MDKIKRTKLVPKLMLLSILIITVFIGFACTFATAKENQRSTKLTFSATEWVDSTFIPPITPFPFPPPPPITFEEDGVFHIIGFWSVHRLNRSVEGEQIIIGYTISIFHVKLELATGKMVMNGQTWFYFTWDDLSCYFTGTINIHGYHPQYMGDYKGKYALQGAGDSEGMKLFGVVWNIDYVGTNELSGIILIPKLSTYYI